MSLPECTDEPMQTSSAPPPAQEDDDDLEEGELKDDDDDDDDDDDVDFSTGKQIGTASNHSNTAAANNDANLDGGQPKRKRKRVVRKVKRKIKVIKKVPKKKPDQQQGQAQAQNPQPMLPQNQQPMLPQTQQTQQIQPQPSQQPPPQQQQPQQQHQPMLTHQPQPMLPQTHSMLAQQQPMLPQQQPMLPQQPPQQPILSHINDNVSSIQQTQPPKQPQNNQLDNLWEQQILMLQELQKQQQNQQMHAEIIRAAATDEDLRVLNQPNFMYLQNHQQQTPSLQQQHQPQTHIQQQQLAPMAPPPVTQAHHQPLQVQPLQPQQPLQQQQNQTPSSPDDEQGKSSYEAISKMLTLLRNSANVSDSSEILNDQDNSSAQQQENFTGDSNRSNTIEYSLVPVLVQGIDYTKYKLLSQYEPKFKNDPRLNQQA